MALACTAAPLAARAALAPANMPAKLLLEVLDVGGFDPLIRRDSTGKITRRNLSFRTAEIATERTVGQLELVEGAILAELTLTWLPKAGLRSLTMYNARVIDSESIRLAQQGRGQDYDEFIAAVESTHGSLRLVDAQQTQVADYRITERGVVEWKRYTA